MWDGHCRLACLMSSQVPQIVLFLHLQVEAPPLPGVSWSIILHHGNIIPLFSLILVLTSRRLKKKKKPYRLSFP